MVLPPGAGRPIPLADVHKALGILSRDSLSQGSLSRGSLGHDFVQRAVWGKVPVVTDVVEEDSGCAEAAQGLQAWWVV